MTDQELADALVARGIGRAQHYNGPELAYMLPMGWGASASGFVRDWRTAGACIDKLQYPIKITSVDNAPWVEITIYSPNGNEESDPIRITAHDVNLPRAICEAFVEATE